MVLSIRHDGNNFQEHGIECPQMCEKRMNYYNLL